VNGDTFRSGNTYPHLISFNAEHRNGHFIADFQGFANSPGKNEHETTFVFSSVRDLRLGFAQKPINKWHGSISKRVVTALAERTGLEPAADAYKSMSY
jgi:hypothetical protein